MTAVSARTPAAKRRKTMTNRRCAIILRAALCAVFAFPLGAQTTRFAVIADTHIGADRAAAGLRAIVAAVNADPGIRFVIHAGDITEAGRDGEFREAKSILGGLTVPAHVLPGNHDLHWMGYGGAGFLQAFGTDRFFFREGNAAFVGLSCGDMGHLASADLDWLEASVRPLPADAEIFVFVHYPPATIDNWVLAHNILRARRTAVIAGHVHADKMTEANGIPVFTVRAALGAPAPAGFNVFNAGADGVTVQSVIPGKEPEEWGRLAMSAWTAAPAIALAPPPPLPGRVLWRQNLRAPLRCAPVTDGKAVYTADAAGRITCLDVKGAIRWTFEDKAPYISRPVLHKKQLFAASSAGRMVKLDAASGRLLASADFGERFTSQLAVFEDNKGKVPRLLAGTASGRLYCINVFNLTDVWKTDAARGLIQTRPLVLGGKAVFGSWDGHAHCVDIETGGEIWSWTENDNFYYSPAGCVPAASGGNVLFCGPDGFTSAVQLVSGRTVWRVEAGGWESLGVSADGKSALIKGRLDSFSILASAGGALLKKISPAHGPGDLYPIEPVEVEGRVLYGAQNGRIYEIDAAGIIRAIADLGPAAVTTLLPLGAGRIAAANVDGVVVLIQLPK
jgi:outer membrane protein assembly factor BamB/predicted phosphodiesterase